MTNDKFWPRNWPRPTEDEAKPVINPSVTSVKWTYDKELLMWRRDLYVRVLWMPTNHAPRWVAVHSLAGRLPPDFETSDDAMTAADKAWPP